MSSSVRSRRARPVRPVRGVRGVAVLAGALLVLSGCGGSGGGHGGTSSTTTEADITAAPTPANAHLSGTVVRIKITGHSVTPDGSEVQATRGKPVTLLIDASAAGALHVHSSPEHFIAFPAGVSAATLTFKNPGVIDVESHTLNKLIVQLEVR